MRENPTGPCVYCGKAGAPVNGLCDDCARRQPIYVPSFTSGVTTVDPGAATFTVTMVSQ